jgi:hypothetical protein
MAQQPDNKPGAYYVSVRRSDGDYRFLLGPFVDDHGKALAQVDAVRAKAEQLDPKAVWYDFGTARIDIQPDRVPPAGILNPYFPEVMQ